MVPWLQETYNAMQLLIGKLDDLTLQVNLKSRQMRTNGGSETASVSDEVQSESRATEGELRRLVDSIVEKGIQIKDHRRGLFDFPYLMDGVIVYLCWLAGEPGIAYWHTVDSGFAGRQPL